MHCSEFSFSSVVDVKNKMAEVVTATVVTGAVKGESQKGKKAAAATKKPKSKATHPPTSEMVTNAIKALKERGGSSLPAIKKYLAGNYKVDVDRLAPFIKKYLRSAVTSGVLIQTKGKGAAGSFKMSKSIAKPKAKSVESKEKKPAAPKKSPKKPKKVKAASDSKKQTVAAKKVEKKKATKVVAKSVKKSAEVKSKVSKQKPTKPTKVAAKSPKPAKAKGTTAVVKKGGVKKAAKK